MIKWINDVITNRKHTKNLEMLVSTLIDNQHRLETEIEQLKARPPVDNFHAVAKDFDVEALPDMVWDAIIQDLKPLLEPFALAGLKQIGEQAVRHSGGVGFRVAEGPMDPHSGFIMYAIQVDLPDVHTRIQVMA